MTTIINIIQSPFEYLGEGLQSNHLSLTARRKTLANAVTNRRRLKSQSYRESFIDRKEDAVTRYHHRRGVSETASHRNISSIDPHCNLDRQMCHSFSMIRSILMSLKA